MYYIVTVENKRGVVNYYVHYSCKDAIDALDEWLDYNFDKWDKNCIAHISPMRDYVKKL